MAIIKNLTYPVDTAALIEDPTPGASKLYIQFDAYDENTLAPLFNQSLNHNTTGTGITGFGTSYVRADALFNSARMYRLGLNGPVTEVQVSNTSNNNMYNNIDPAPFLSMDPARPIRRTRYDTDGVNSAIGLFGPKIASNTSFQRSLWTPTYSYEIPYTAYCLRLNAASIQSTLPYRNTVATADGVGSIGARAGACFYPVYFNSSTGNLVLIPFGGRKANPEDYGNATDYPQFPSLSYGMRFSSYLSANPTWSGASTTNYANKTNQFVGVDSAGRSIFFHNDLVTDYNHQVVRYTDADNTSAILFNNTTAPVAGGTSAGGNRGTSFGSYVAKYSSLTFADPTSAGNVAWYTPYLDSAGKLHPLFFQWNRTTDAFTRNEDITVNWGTATNQDNVWLPDSVSAASNDQAYGLQRLLYNETWTVTNGGTTTRYLMLMQLHGSGAAYDTIPKARTFVVFSVNSGSPKSLTYHSSVTIPSTPKNIIWFNDAKTQLGVFCDSNFYTYSFTSGAGWTLTGSIPYKFSSVGVDGLGRIWALAQGTTGYGELHMITLNVPVTISVTAPQINYNFTGTNINTSITVNAYDTDGSRIAVAVKLVVDGGSMAFAGSNLTTTVNTSASADTTVPVTITGAGISNVIASVVL